MKKGELIMLEKEMQKEIIQAGINYLLSLITDKAETLSNHPKDDSEFIEMIERQMDKLIEKKDYAVNWRNSI